MPMTETQRIQLIKYQMEQIKKYIKDEDFQLKFFNDLYTTWSYGTRLSDKQVASLDKIYERVTA